MMRWMIGVAFAAVSIAWAAWSAEPPGTAEPSGVAVPSAVVHKAKVDVHAQPQLDAPKIATLSRDTAVQVTAQKGLWYELMLSTGTSGYVRVDDVRVDYGQAGEDDATLRILMGGSPGQGRVTETAGVRGIDESELKAASLNQAQLTAMIANRVDEAAAAAFAAQHGWSGTTVAFSGEAKPAKKGAQTGVSPQSAAEIGSAALGAAGSVGNQLSSMFGGAAKLAPKSEAEQSAEELALGPEIAGRVLGARPLWDNPEAQQRVNRVGRWVASQTSRPELPWTFGVIDTPEVNAFAAPGGFILIARGMYELVGSDAELSAVLGHEVSHCVQRDHYNVIRKQQLASAGKELAMRDVTLTGDAVAVGLAKRYADEYGATIVLTSLDRDAEYKADEAAQIYVARAGMNPLALYSVFQKMTALGSASPELAELFKTHPSLDARMDKLDKRGYGALAAYTTRE
jgi:beta-barrel assembly-enhancing protease